MLAAIGLDRLDPTDLYLILACVAIGGVAVGWITDAVLARAAYGVIGNGIIAAIGALAALAAYNRLFEPLRLGYAVNLVVLAFLASMAAVLLAAMLRKAFR